MKASEIKALSLEDLRIKLDDLIEENFNLRFQQKLGQSSSPIRLRQVRREIARVHTILRQNELGLITLDAKAEGIE
jgi:large subunit ribosomal protein L29